MSAFSRHQRAGSPRSTSARRRAVSRSRRTAKSGSRTPQRRRSASSIPATLSGHADDRACRAAPQPYGIVFSPVGDRAFVALEAPGAAAAARRATRRAARHRCRRARTRGTCRSTATAPRLYVSHFVTPRAARRGTRPASPGIADGTGGKVVVADTATLAARPIDRAAAQRRARFREPGQRRAELPRRAVASRRTARRGWVPSKQDNIKRGMLRSGANLNFQNTVRAISSRIDLATNAEDYAIAHRPRQREPGERSGLRPLRRVPVRGARDEPRSRRRRCAQRASEFFRIHVGPRAAGARAVAGRGPQLFVSNFMDRTVGVYDLSALMTTGQWTAPLLATLQRGRHREAVRDRAASASSSSTTRATRASRATAT